MHAHPISELMHAVLDGKATSEQTRELERLLDADPKARAHFDDLRRLFEGLAAVPNAYPPEGLVASVIANLPQYATPSGRFSQLFAWSRVIELASKEARVTNPGTSATVHPVNQPGPIFRAANMSGQMSSSINKRKVWIGAGVGVVVAAAVAVFSAVDFPPGGKDVTGTIVPAQRYRAEQ